MEALILIGFIFLFLFLNVPVAISLGASILIFLTFFFDLVSPSWLAQGMFTSLDSFPLMAVPFFMFAGTIMEQGGLSKRLINFARSLVGETYGGMAYVMVIACFFFGAISGSGPATVAAIGGIMIPEMIKEGYTRKFSSALAANAGSLGVIVPPSIPMVVYCIATGVSVGDLFLAGFGPGLVIAGSLCIASRFILKKENTIAVRQKKVDGQRRNAVREILLAAKEAIWSLLIPVIILGGIYGGIFTPTEAAVVTVVYSLIISAFVYKEMTMKKVIAALVNSSKQVGSVLLIAAFATPLGRLLTMMQLPGVVKDAIVGFSDNKIVVLLLLNVFLLFCGMFLDTTSCNMILAPILLPVAQAVGVDPVHFGIIMVVNLAIGFVTPPVGVNLLVGSNTGKISFEEIVVESVPMIIALLIALMIITYCPVLSTFLPSVLGG